MNRTSGLDERDDPRATAFEDALRRPSAGPSASRPASAHLANLAPRDWNRLYDVALLCAAGRAKDRDRARRAAHEAIVRLSESAPWDVARGPSLERYLAGAVRSVLSHEHDSRRPGYESAAAVEQQVLGEPGSIDPERALLARDEEAEGREGARRVLDALREKLAGHPLELRILALAEEEVDEPAEQARHIGCPVQEIYRARERIRRYARSMARAGDVHP